MSPAVADEMQLETSADGVAIAEIEDGSVAQRVGFQKGDVILAINGERVASSKDLERMIARSSRGMWQITINRGGQVITSVLGG
jgi:S1-C subfamily serine protease